MQDYKIFRDITKWFQKRNELRGHSFSTYAKLSEKLTFPTPGYANVGVRIRG